MNVLLLFWLGLLETKVIFLEDSGREYIMRMKGGEAKEVNSSLCQEGSLIGRGVTVGFYEDIEE